MAKGRLLIVAAKETKWLEEWADGTPRTRWDITVMRERYRERVTVAVVDDGGLTRDALSSAVAEAEPLLDMLIDANKNLTPQPEEPSRG